MENKLLDKYEHLKAELFSKPKKVFAGAILIMVLSLIFSIFQYFFFPPKVSLGDSIPILYTKSDQVKNKMDKKEKEMEKTIQELSAFREKSKTQSLTKSDSVRIEFLYQQYQNLKNGL